MTREEEIKLVAECAVTDEKYSEFKGGLIWGAKLADKTIINKACEWLSANKDNYIIDIEGETIVDDTIIEDFRKAMEG